MSTQSEERATTAVDPISALTDRIEIGELVARLARAMDTRDWSLLSTCFTDDAVGHFATGPVSGLPAIRVQYRVFLTPLDATQHLIGNTEVTLTGDIAFATSYFQAQHVRALEGGAGQFLIGGRYTDHLTRGPHGWRISSRSVAAIWTSGDRRVIAGTLDPAR